jgi:antitoxin ParD1/3/4
MNVSLTPELELLVYQKVQSGMYTSASEVIREALRLLKEQDDAKKLEQLRADIAIGAAQAERGQVVPGEQAIQQLKARYTKKG